MQKLSEEAFASAAWTTIIEPGDELAGLLRLTLGSKASLDLLIARASAMSIAQRVLATEHAELARMRFGRFESTIEDSLQRWLPRLSKTAVESALKVAAVSDAKFLCQDDEAWPSSLSDLGLGMPAGLWVRGNLTAITPSVAIVGSRTSTGYGNWVCAEFVAALSERGISVVSGGAFGIDAAVHRSANAMGVPNFAVMAGGVDQFYPSSNADLLRSVTSNGAVLSELPPGARPTRWRFLQRNRLIAAFGRATVVVEAGHRSGAINTANHANSIGRPVGAVPGQISQSTSDGCHRLIRDGLATLLSGPRDLIELAGFAQVELAESASLGELELRALDALTGRFQEQPAIAKRAGMTGIELAVALGGLEMGGRVERNAQGSWRKRLNL